MALSKLDVQEFLSNYKALIEAVTGISPDGFEEWLDARDKMLGSWQEAKVSQQLSENPIYQVLPQLCMDNFASSRNIRVITLFNMSIQSSFSQCRY